MKVLCVISYLILLIFFIILFIKGNFPEKIMNYLKSGDDYDYKMNYLYNVRLEQHMSYTGQADMVMLGDSMTEFAEWNELLGRNDVVNRGISGDITEGMLSRMETVIKVEPRICFFMGGINDIIRDVPYEITRKNIISIIETLRQNNIEPVIQSVIFTGNEFEDFKEINMTVRKLNSEIEEYGKKNNIVFIDLNQDLSDAGYLKDEYTYDGLHLNAKGYLVWRDKIMQYFIISEYSQEQFSN